MRKRAEFEAFLADRMVEAWTMRVRTRDLGPGDGRSREAVTLVRGWGSVLTDYCGMGPIGFADTRAVMSREQVVAKLDRFSRFNRCRADGTAEQFRDSVAYWEYTSCHGVIAALSALRTARGMLAPGDTLRRLREEAHIAVFTVSAYCGAFSDDIERMAELEPIPSRGLTRDGREAESVSPLRDVMRTGRPQG